MRVYSRDFDYLYRITAFESSQEVKRYTGAGTLVLTVDAESDAAHFLQIYCFVVTEDGTPYIVQHVEQDFERVTISAYSCHAMFAARLTGGGALKNEYINRTGSADDVVKHFINESKGDLPIVTAAVRGGASIKDQTRLKGLGDEVVRVLNGAGLGEMFTLDAANKCVVFDTFSGEDKTNAVVFDVAYKNIASMRYTEDATARQSTIYVGGAGEGDEREIVVVGDAAAGLDRVERFRDARDVAAGDTATLTERGAQGVVPILTTVSTEAVADAGIVYGVDYGLGDVVTTRVVRKTYEKQGDYFEPVTEKTLVAQRITEVCITREGGAEHIDLRFGDQPITPTQFQTMAADVAQLKSVEGGAGGIVLPLGVDDGGTGGTTAAQARENLDATRRSIPTITGNGTDPNFWRGLESGATYWNASGSISNMPSAWGFANVLHNGGDFTVIYHVQSTGAIYRASGNASTSVCEWRQLHDSESNNVSPRLRLTASDDVSPTSTNHALQIGNTSTYNIAIDGNEIMARRNGAVSELYLNDEGGAVYINNHLAYHAGILTFQTS